MLLSNVLANETPMQCVRPELGESLRERNRIAGKLSAHTRITIEKLA